METCSFPILKKKKKNYLQIHCNCSTPLHKTPQRSRHVPSYSQAHTDQALFPNYSWKPSYSFTYCEGLTVANSVTGSEFSPYMAAITVSFSGHFLLAPRSPQSLGSPPDSLHLQSPPGSSSLWHIKAVTCLWSFFPPLTVFTFLVSHIILQPQIPPTGHGSQTCIGCADLPPNSWLTYPTAFATSFPLKYFIDTWTLACLNYDVSCITTVHCIQPSSSKMKALSPLWPKSFMSFLKGHFFTEASPQNLKLQPHFRSILPALFLSFSSI